jgi:hypothetical protein
VKLRLAVLCALSLTVSAAAGAATPFRATFAAPTHTPKSNAKWFYSVHASRSGKPARATITAQVVDPVGGVHAVEFGDTHRNVTNLPFTGVFRDFARFPPEARGIKVTFRVIVRAAGARRVFTYWIRAR